MQSNIRHWAIRSAEGTDEICKADARR